MFRESGIFDELRRQTLNPKNDPDYDLKIIQFTNDIDKILLNVIKDLYLLYLLVNVISIILVIEIIRKNINKF